jgi:hypothetical protein
MSAEAIPRLLAATSSDATKAPELWRAVDSETPVGHTLLKALACSNFPHQGLHNLIVWLTASPTATESTRHDAAVLMGIIANGVISIASFKSCTLGGDDADASRTPAGFPGQSTVDLKAINSMDVGVILTNIAKAKAAAEVLVQGPLFLPADDEKGATLGFSTVLGALLGSLNPFGAAPSQQGMHLRLLQLYSSGSPRSRRRNDDGDDGNASDISAAIARGVRNGAAMFKVVVEAFLRSGPAVRTATLTFLSRALTYAAVFRKSMVKEDEEMNFVAAVILSHACVQLAMPIIEQRGGGARPWFPYEVPAEYFFEGHPAALCAFPADEERVMSGEGAIPAPPRPRGESAPEEYPAKMHLLALGIRALSVFVKPCYRRWHEMAQRLRYPGLPNNQRKIVSALHEFYLAFLYDSESMGQYLALADSVAQWLVVVLKVDVTGQYPKPVPKNADAADDDAAPVAAPVPPSFARWANLPLTILDDIFGTTKLITAFERRPPPLDVGFYQIRHLAALLLVVMGDLRCFPKPHTHAIFPQFLMVLTEPRLPYRRDFMNHEWFAPHVMRACVDCYIAVQPCDYDRQQARLYLSLALTDLLKDASLASAMQPKLNDPNDVTLEQLSSMVTAEATGALDHVFEALQKMREIEMQNNRQPPAQGHPSFDDYQTQGNMLAYEVQRATTTIDVFDALTQHFRKGMAKRLVVQQISGALITFLIRLAGPSAFELKIADPAKYGFKPREMITSIIHNFIKFANSDKFCRYCVQSQTNLKNFDAAVGFVMQRQLVPMEDATVLAEMSKKIHAVAEDIEREDAFLEDAPDWARCSLMFDPLKDPVALPTTSADLTYVERESIRHHLLTERKHPFTREPLTMGDVDKFNARPEVTAKLQDLKVRIAAWLEQAATQLQKA